MKKKGENISQNKRKYRGGKNQCRREIIRGLRPCCRVLLKWTWLDLNLKATTVAAKKAEMRQADDGTFLKQEEEKAKKLDESFYQGLLKENRYWYWCRTRSSREMYGIK